MNISWKTIFQANSGGFSSKRIFGGIGILICFVIFIVSFITEKPIPEFGDLIFVTSASLLGLDSVTGIFNKSVNKNN